MPTDRPARVGPVVIEMFEHQRACRSFSSAAVEDEVIGEVLGLACCAPSAENSQPWVFVVVRDRVRRAAIWELAERAWRGGGREASSALRADLFADVDRGLTGGYVEAPVTVVVGADLERCRPQTAASSIYPAVQNLLLAATAVGLGSALTTIATVFRSELGDVVGLPDHVEPRAVVPLGYPSHPLGRSRREPFAEHTHRDRFGVPW